MAGPSSQPDTNDDHVKRDGDDRRHLVMTSVITFQSGSLPIMERGIRWLTVSKTRYWTLL